MNHADRPSPAADLNARFQERVSEMTAAGTLASPDALTAPAPTVDSPASVPTVAAPTAPTTETPPAGAPAAKIPATGAHAPDDPSAASAGPAAAAIAAAKPQTPADVVLAGTQPASATPVAPTAPAPAAAAGAAPEATASAAPGTAAAPTEPEREWVDVTVESGIPDVKYEIRVPKEQAEQVKRGWLREADYTRKTMAFGKYREFLTELVAPDPTQGGRTAMDVLKPYIERAITDPAFGARATELYNRAIQGRPMFFADEINPGAAAPAGAPAAPAPAAGAAGPMTLESLGVDPEDPWVQAQLPALNAMIATMNRQQVFIDAQETQQRTMQSAQVQREQARQAGNQARAFIESKYPGEYDGTEGEQRMIGLYNYANQNGYIAQTGSIAAGMLAARIDIDRARVAQAGAATASVAAKTLAEVEAESQALVSRASAGVAATLAPPNGATTPPSTTAAKVAMRNADGSRRPAKQIVQEAAALALASQAR